MEKILCEDSEGGKNFLEEAGALTESIAEGLWRAMAWTWDTRPSAVVRSLKYASWKSTEGRQNRKALSMMTHTTKRDGSTNGCGTRMRVG